MTEYQKKIKRYEEQELKENLKDYKFIKNILKNKEYIELEEFEQEYRDMSATMKFKYYIMIFKLKDKIYEVNFSDLDRIKEGPNEVIEKTKTIKYWSRKKED